MLSSNEADLSVCGFYDVYGETCKPWREPNDITQTLTGTQATENMLYTLDFDASAWAKLYKASLFENIRYPAHQLYEEVATTYKVLLKCDRVTISRDPKYYYVKRTASIVTGQFTLKSMAMLTACQEIYAYAQSQNQELIPSATRKLLYGCFYLLKTMGADYPKHSDECKEIIAIYKQHRKTVWKDAKAPGRDKFAILTLAFGIGFYQQVWKWYQRATHRVISQST